MNHPIIAAHIALEAIAMLPDVRVSAEWGQSVTIVIAGQTILITLRLPDEELYENLLQRAADNFIAWLADNEEEYHTAKRSIREEASAWD